jgi:hypothetical protein
MLDDGPDRPVALAVIGGSLYPVLLVDALVGAASAGTKFEDGYGQDPKVPLTYPFENVAPTPDHSRKFDMEVSVRIRSVSVPRSVLDTWFFDQDDPNWAYIEPRPAVRGTAMGLEYGLRGAKANGTFYVEFVDAAVGGGYWDDIEDPADHQDGDFLVPSSGMGLVAFGADSAYEAHIVRLEQTGGRFGMSFLTGGGLGLGILAGRLDVWRPDTLGNPAYKRYLDGLPPDSGKQIPRVYPMVDVNLGLRFNFGDPSSGGSRAACTRCCTTAPAWACLSSGDSVPQAHWWRTPRHRNTCAGVRPRPKRFGRVRRDPGYRP